MDERKEKSIRIVRSIKLLEGVQKTTTDPVQKARVKDELINMRKILQEMYPKTDLAELEEAIYSDIMVLTEVGEDDLKEYDLLKDIEISEVSHFVEDVETNRAISVFNYFEERIWGIISDQHTKLDFSNSGMRDTLYRKMDTCNRSIKLFTQTLADLEKTVALEYSSQLSLMRMKQGRLVLFDINDFFKQIKVFVSDLVADAEFGGNMILNPDEKVKYAGFERYRTYEGWVLLDALKHMKKFVDQVLDVVTFTAVKKII